MDKETTSLIIIGAIYGLAAGYYIYRGIKEKKAFIPSVIEAEKKRKAHPDMQTGRFNRLYTMPYNDEVNENTVHKYLEQLYPKYKYSVRNGSLQVEDSDSSEERILYFTQLRDEDITAIQLTDPHEMVNQGGHKSPNYTTRTSMYDLGFSKSIRTAILHFQELSVAKRK